jgi:hypothetical protein
MTDTTILGALKDMDSNFRSEVSYLDRNLMNGIASNSANIIQSGVGLQAQTAGQLNRTTDYLSNTFERQNIQSQGLVQNGFKDIKDTVLRTGDFGLNDSRRNSEFMLGDSRRSTDQVQNAVERNGTAANLAIANTKADLFSAIERANVGTNLNNYNLAKDTISSVERNGTQNSLATEKVGSAAVNETLRSSGLIRDLVNHQSSENRGLLGQLSSHIYTHARDAAVASKETELKIAEAAFKAQLQGSMVLSDMGKMKSDLERQAAENAALSARDMALLSRDILMSKGEILKNAADNTAAIQIEALRQKDALSCQIHHTYDKLNSLNTDRIRDNLNDYRAENVGLRYHDDWRHRPDIHNNLHSHMGRGFEGGFPNGPRT